MPAAAGGRFLPGAVLAERYRIVAPLGRGGMGEVYRADDLKLGQPVALKFLPPGLEQHPDRLSWLLTEVRLARQVSHPNVCRVYDVGEVDGQHFLSMEYVDGEDLASLLRRIGRLPGERATQVARQICAGLAAAHEQGILHRDLKPSNVMIDGRGRARLTDFGLAGIAGGIAEGDIRTGTPAYMAPEQLAGAEVSVRSDLYALGLVLYELFTGRRAFEGVSPEDRSSRPQTATPSSPASHVSDLDPAAERAIMRCLAPQPSERPASALAVAAALPGGNPLAEALAAGDTPSPELVAEAGRATATRPMRAFMAAALAVAVYLGGAWWASHMFLRSYVPLDKPPLVLADRAREVVRAFGYDEDIHEKPYDRAYGYSVWQHQLNWIARNDSSADRWERLRRANPGVVSFWYRQSPGPLIPSSDWGSFVPGRAGRWSPFPQRAGETLVSLDALGRLELFAYTPHRFLIDSLKKPEPDWSAAFALAGLDTAAFERVEPHYQRYAAPEHRAEWLARDPGPDGNRVRVAAGAQEGRVILFAVLDPWEIETVSSPPTRFAGITPLAVTAQTLTLVVIVIAGFMARAHVRAGRADRRGAPRLMAYALLLALIIGFTEVQNPVHAFTFGLAFTILGTAAFYCAVIGVVYVALEPYARRIWPTILVSWSRLLSTRGFNARDPEVGRSVLAGLAAASPYPLLWALHRWSVDRIVGAPMAPATGDWSAVLDGRAAFGGIAVAFVIGPLIACLFTFVVVGSRYLLRRRALSIGVALVVTSFFTFEPLPGPAGITSAVLLVLIGNGILMVALLRFGLLAVAVAQIAILLMPIAVTTDWSAWHALPAWLATGVIVLLAVYGYWASTSGTVPARVEALQPATG